MMRRTLRTGAAFAVLVYAGYAVIVIRLQLPGAWIHAAGAAILLLVLFYALGRRRA